MKYFAPFSVLFLVLVSLLAVSGCTSSPTTPVSDGDGHADHDHSNDMSDMDKMKAELAKMSPEDAASAEKQHTCPVSGEMLGTMGAPKKVDVDGEQVWICCEGCSSSTLWSRLSTGQQQWFGQQHCMLQSLLFAPIFARSLSLFSY